MTLDQIQLGLEYMNNLALLVDSWQIVIFKPNVTYRPVVRQTVLYR